MDFDFSNLPWPIREISNFIRYRKYIKTQTDREKVKELRERVGKYGINHGVEDFMTYREAKGLANLSDTAYQLRRMSERREYSLKYPTHVKKEEQPQKQERVPYDKDWVPNFYDLIGRKANREKTPFQDICIRVYIVKEHGASVAVILYKDDVFEVLVGENYFDVLSDAESKAEVLANYLGLKR